MIGPAVVAVSLGLLWLFRTDLRRPQAHGFYRFFAFQALLLLIGLNARAWFRDPAAPRQIASWLMLAVAGALALHGFWLLRQRGQQAGPVENTTRLVTTGAYGYIRHPLYASLGWLGGGAFLKAPSLAGLALLAALAAALYATARVEEAEMLRKFGSDYAAYMRRTRRFVPFVI